ncbi:hypothetical protein JOM56_013444 [Amanita muscaria]
MPLLKHPIEQVLKAANIKKEDIYEIVLVSSSTCIPKEFPSLSNKGDEGLLIDKERPAKKPELSHISHTSKLIGEAEQHSLFTDPSILAIPTPEGRYQTVIPYRLGMVAMARCDQGSAMRGYPPPGVIPPGRPGLLHPPAPSSNGTPVSVQHQVKKMPPPTSVPQMHILSNGGMRPPMVPAAANLHAAVNPQTSTPAPLEALVNGPATLATPSDATPDVIANGTSNQPKSQNQVPVLQVNGYHLLANYQAALANPVFTQYMSGQHSGLRSATETTIHLLLTHANNPLLAPRVVRLILAMPQAVQKTAKTGVHVLAVLILTMITGLALPLHLPQAVIHLLWLLQVPSQDTSQHTVHDITYFFTRGKALDGTTTICKACKKKRDEDPTLPVVEFSPNSSNSTLRKHLDAFHHQECVDVCTANGWKIQLLTWIRCNTQPLVIAADTTHEPFTDDTFIRKIVNWVIVDDQTFPHCTKHQAVTDFLKCQGTFVKQVLSHKLLGLPPRPVLNGWTATVNGYGVPKHQPYDLKVCDLSKGGSEPKGFPKRLYDKKDDDKRDVDERDVDDE